MSRNFHTNISFDGRTLSAVILPALRKNGMHFEVNIASYPRFFMKWSELDRYDIVNGEDLRLPDGLLLAISDAIEQEAGRKI